MVRPGQSMSSPKLRMNSVAVPPNGEHVVRPNTADARALLAAGYEGIRMPVAVLLDNVRSMYNVGAFFRVADGVGLEKVCLCGITAHPPKKAITKTALGAEESVAWEHDWDAVRMAQKIHHAGYEIAAI